MKKPLLLSGAAVLLVSAGFIAGRSSAWSSASRDGAERENQRTSTRSGSTARHSSAGSRGESTEDMALAKLLDGRSPEDIPVDEAYQLILPYLKVEWSDDPLLNARKSYQYHLLMAKLPLPVLEQLVVMSRANGISEHRVSDIFGCYAARDWDKAMAWGATQRDESVLRSGAIGRLAMTDPARAAELYDRSLMEGGKRPELDAYHHISAAFARQGQAEFFRFFDTQPSASTSPLLYNAIRSLPEDQIPAFMVEMNKRVAAGTLDKSNIDSLMREVIARHPEEGDKWLETLEPGKERANGELTLASILVRQGRTEEAEERLTRIMAAMPGKEKEYILDRGRYMITGNPEVAEKLVAMLPEGESLTHDQVKGWESAIYNRPDGMMSVVKLLKSPEEQSAYLVDAFGTMTGGGRRRMNAKDFNIIAHQLKALHLTGEPGEKAQAALDAAAMKALEK